MRLTIETTAILPYGLMPSPNYSDLAVAVAMGRWVEYLAGNGEFAMQALVLHPVPDEARKAGYPEEIGKGRVVQFRDIRSILVEAK